MKKSREILDLKENDGDLRASLNKRVAEKEMSEKEACRICQLWSKIFKKSLIKLI